MRKVTQNAANALFAGQNYSQGNTTVTHIDECGGLTRMYLHGNLIAGICQGVLSISDGGGWTTATTKERINGVLDRFGLNAYVQQRDFKWYFIDHGIAEDWTGWKDIKVWEDN